MRRARLTAAGAFAAALAGVLSTGAGAAVGAHVRTVVVPVDRQDYVAAVSATNPHDGTTVDPYDGDPSTIHVAINGGAEVARSYVHVALDYLPPGARATQVTLTLHLTQQSDASNTGVYPAYNVDTADAIVQACALTSELPAQFDAQHPPAYDCQHGSAVGHPNKAHDTFTFALGDLLAYWAQHGNTGAALVPVGSGDPSQNWAVGFYKSRSAASVSYLPALPAHQASSGGTATSPLPASTGGGTPGRPAGTPTGPAAVAPAAAPPASASAGAAPVVAATPAPAGVAPTRPAASAPQHSTPGGSTTWPWVLLGSLLLAGAAVGIAHRAAVAAFVARVGPPGIRAFRAHPRAYSVAAAAIAWGLVFTGYSLVTQPGTHPAPDLASDVQGTGTAAGVGAPAAAPTTGGAAAAAGNAGVTAAAAASGPGAGAPAAGAGAGSSTNGGAGQPAGAGATSPAAAARAEFSGAGSYRTINGVRVFFPAQGGPPVADLYHGADDTIGITPTQIELCAHAALTYGSAFHISASDLNVYWNYLNDHGGIYGRHIHGDYENDNYDPGTAVQAAQTCKDLDTFFLLGGIGFDQIPAVRQWAEQNHELYYHHIATIEGSAGLRYSFSPLPTVEQMGTLFGQLAVQRFRGQKIGILYRQSSNWSPGSDAFARVVRAAGMQVVSYGVTINQGNYTQELAQLNAAGVKVVFAWENALATTEMIKQAQGQSYHPAWLVFPFNLETQTLGQSSLDQPLLGVAAWDAYDPHYYGGGFASYAAEIHEFEAEYKKYDPSADLSGDGGDLLFLNWEAQRQVADLLTQCGQQCTRNKLAGLLLAGYDRTVAPNCRIDFDATADHHHGGQLVNVLQVVKDPNGRPNFVPVQRCVSSIGAGG